MANGTVLAERERVTKGSFHGQVVRSPFGTEYAIGLIDEAPARYGGALWIPGYDYCTGQQWTKIQGDLSLTGVGDFGSSPAVDFQLHPGEEKATRILIAWYSPIWKGDKTNTYTRMYTKRYKDATDVASFVADDHAALLRHMLAWQEAVYSADAYPVWLREGLVNVLHLMTKTGLLVGDICASACVGPGKLNPSVTLRASSDRLRTWTSNTAAGVFETRESPGMNGDQARNPTSNGPIQIVLNVRNWVMPPIFNICCILRARHILRR